MVAVRRIYFYLVSAVSLGVLLGQLAVLGSEVLGFLLTGGTEVILRQTVATSGAAAVVGLPVWVLHWQWAQRTARRDAAERASTLRRLYLYGMAAALAFAVAAAASRALGQLLVPLEGAQESFRPVELARALWEGALPAAFWAYHFRVARLDRAGVGEIGGSATLRRWYAYGLQFVAFVNMLFWSRTLLSAAAASLPPTGGVARVGPVVSTDVAFALVWLTLWLFHFQWANREPIAQEDRRSTLRAVQGFGVVAWSTALVLTEAARTLYYLLARALGVSAPGGVQVLDFGTLAQPLSTVLVFGAGWAFMRHQLVADRVGAEATRRAGVRRLYVHLVAILGLASLAAGLGGLLDALFEQLVAQGVPPESWRDQVSWALTLVVVGLPVWLRHWRAAPPTSERLALSRRLYLFATLLVGVLAGLGSAAGLISTVLRALLTTDADLWVQGSRFAAALIVAAGVAGYHFRVLRADAAERRAEPALSNGPASPVPVLVVEIVGASDTDVRQALSTLPEGASYSVRAAPAMDLPSTGEGPEAEA